MRTKFLVLFSLFFVNNIVNGQFLNDDDTKTTTSNSKSFCWNEIKTNRTINASHCMTELKKYEIELKEKEKTVKGDDKTNLKIEIKQLGVDKKWLERVIKIRVNVAKKDRQNERRQAEQRERVEDAYALANIHGCGSVIINPDAEISRWNRVVARINITNNSKHYVDIVLSGLTKPAVVGMPPGCTLSLHISQKYIDSYMTNNTLTAKFYDAGKSAEYKGSSMFGTNLSFFNHTYIRITEYNWILSN